MPKHCAGCGSQSFRLSHFRKKDVWHLFALQYPVRCLHCTERSHVSLFKLSAYSHKLKTTSGAQR